MDTEEKLIQKLRAIEALFSGAGTEGERAAAGFAAERISARLEKLRETDLPTEFRFTMPDNWSRKLFCALLRRYGLEPYRYERQRYTTVVVMVPEKFLADTIRPQFRELHTTLHHYLDSVTNRVIKESINGDDSEIKVVRELGAGISQ